jgi:TP901 family phage tail tape measure protein
MPVGGANAGEIKARMTLEMGDFSRKVDKAKKDIRGLSDSGKSLKSSLSEISQVAGVAGLALTAGIGAAVKVGMDFEAQMARVGAISGASAEQLDALTAEAMRLGSETSKSALQVAQGMEIMAAAGYEVNDIIAAMPGIISASVASGEDMARVTEVVSAALNAFQLEASEASRVADILAQAANDSAASVDDLGYAFKYAAPVANQLGISIYDLSAAVEIMTNNGLKGEQAGTTLRMALLRLAQDSGPAAEALNELGIETEGANGKMRPLSEIIDLLRKKTENMTTAQKAATLQTIFGTEALTGMMTLVNSAPGEFDGLVKALEESAGASEEAAKKMQDNLRGSLEQLGGAAETAAIGLYNGLKPALRDVVEATTEFINQLSQSGAFQRFGKSIAEVIEFLSSAEGRFITVAGVVALVGSRIVSILPSLSAMTTAFRTLWTAIAAGQLAMGPAGWIVAGLSVIAGLFAANTARAREFTTVTAANVREIYEQTTAQDRLIDSFLALERRSKLTTQEFGRYLDLQTRLKSETDPTKQKQLADEMERLREKSGLSNEEFKRMVELNSRLVQTVPQAAGEVTKYGNKIASAADQVKRMNAEQRELAQMKLWTQVANGIANVANWEKEAQRYAAAYNQAKKEANNASQKLIDINRQINETEAQINAARESGNAREAAALQRKLAGLNIAKQIVSDTLNEASAEAEANEKSLKATQNKIKALNSQKQVLKEIIFQEAGITQESQKNVSAIQQLISKNEVRIAQLQAAKREHRGNQAEIDKEIQKLTNQNNKYTEAISKLNQIEGETAGVGKEIDKNTNKASAMNKELSRKVKKPVDTSDIDSSRKKTDDVNARIQKIVKKNIDLSQFGIGIRNAESLNSKISKSVTKPVGQSSINSAINRADELHRNLGRSQTKRVSIFTTIVESVKRVFSGKSHHGGIIKRHNGGTVPMDEQFVPGRQGVYARLMGGEMILTRTQQARLFNLLQDAQSTRRAIESPAPQGQEPLPIQLHTTVQLDGRTLGKAVDEIMYDRQTNKLRAKGISGRRTY